MITVTEQSIHKAYRHLRSALRDISDRDFLYYDDRSIWEYFLHRIGIARYSDRNESIKKFVLNESYSDRQALLFSIAPHFDSFKNSMRLLADQNMPVINDLQPIALILTAGVSLNEFHRFDYVMAKVMNACAVRYFDKT